MIQNVYDSVRKRAEELDIELTPNRLRILSQYDESKQLRSLTNPIAENIIENVKRTIIYNIQNGYDIDGNCVRKSDREYAK